ncbi:MAG: two-component system, chemotaxis family, sensor histidine kinase and response regulator WspE [Candidatus Magnetoglobus multicellularis str. Araruama]|uniref:histidine kinase n=1 Tax=Candidatus Magnetoglobus multicellularis str. Araruama TaxID=890399 RepID=A0A1V1PGG9_9BACT|nr:MAG: two-component system, chemotaxis family, sensor histidine kinase and response regulator WspE [Candidatus Magnetoglobus multicellularis str. Araruama]
MSQIDFMEIFDHQLSDEIRKATDLLLQLEKSPEKTDFIHELMRIFHSIKGAARAVNMDDIKRITHRLEDLYQGIFEGKATYHQSLINLSFGAIDMIKTIVSNRKQGLEAFDSSFFFNQVDSFLAGNYSDIQQQSTYEPESKTTSETITDNSDDTTTVAKSASTQEATDISVSCSEDNKLSAPSENSSQQYSQNDCKQPESSDALMNLIGELTVSIGSLEDHRLEMRQLLNHLVQLQGDISKLTENEHHTKELSSKIMNRVRQITQKQTRGIEILDSTENRLKFLTSEIDEKVTQSRLVELNDVFSDYPRMVRDLSLELNKKCDLQISGQTTRIDQGVLDMVRLPMVHIIRNAVDHGIESPEQRKHLNKPETGKIVIHAEKKGSQISISIADDGCGIDETRLAKKIIERGDTTKELWEKMTPHERYQFIFLPGFTTSAKVTETSGRGIGLDIVKTEIEKTGGRVLIENNTGKGLTIKLELPVSLSLTPCILVKAGTDPFFGIQHYAFPETEISDIRKINKEDQCTIEGQEYIRIEDETIMLYDFCSMMNLNPVQSKLKQKRVLILNAGTYRIGLVVENIFEEQHVVIRQLDERLGKMPNVEGVTLLKDGNVALIVDIKDIIQNIDSSDYSQYKSITDDTVIEVKQDHILVVEDSQTVREVERHFLESAGYKVTTAVNGVDGLNKLKSGHFDLVISDIDMPRMNGIDMIQKVRADAKYSEIPVIVVSYKDRDADRQKADDVGVNLYVTKSEFDSASMLERIRNLL